MDSYRQAILEIFHFPEENLAASQRPDCDTVKASSHYENYYFPQKNPQVTQKTNSTAFCHLRHTKRPKPRLPPQKHAAHKTTIVPYALSVAANGWKSDLPFDCCKTTITSKKQNQLKKNKWKQNGCEFCLHIKVGISLRITLHSPWVVTYKMQNLVASPSEKKISPFSCRKDKTSFWTGLKHWDAARQETSCGRSHS